MNRVTFAAVWESPRSQILGRLVLDHDRFKLRCSWFLFLFCRMREHALSLAQTDRHGRDVRAALWPDRHRLFVTVGPHVETGREAIARYIRHDLGTAGAAGNISRNTAGRLGPGTGKRAALGNDV